ncbi:MAG TPA: tRNA pseudouridine(38-40) synthase TruA [Bacteroidia bacterium]|nr:tRNA pseudouridine(38-40) synthase TruA [Bacteroidia bacterium]
MSRFHRYFIRLSYNGTGFCGWQYQPGMATIQETVEEKLGIMLREKIDVVGCGRTDSGVHAKKYFAHFDSIAEGLDKDEKVIFRLNKMLPAGIAIQKIHAMADNAHARFAAVARSYEYHISRVKDPFGPDLSWELHEQLDVNAMNECARIIPAYNDFAAFSKTGSDNKTTLCKVTVSYWEEKGDKLIYHITANRFLRNMVRAIVGTLVEAGKGRISPGDVRRIIESGKRSEAGQSVPAEGLYLSDVRYPAAFQLEEEESVIQAAHE